MANYSDLFPNLDAGIDFISSTEVTTQETAVVGSTLNNLPDWATALNSYGTNAELTTAGITRELIPAAILPNFTIGEVHTAQLTTANTAASITALITELNADAVLADEVIHEGDTIVILGSGTQSTTALTVIYTNSTGKTVNGTTVFLAGDFHSINSGAGVDSLEDDDNGNITLSGGVETSTGVRTGAVKLALDSSLTNIASISNTTASSMTVGVTQSNTTIHGNVLSLQGGLSAAIEGGANGATVASETGNVTLNSGLEVRVAGEDITNGTHGSPNVIGVGPDGKLQTLNVVTGGGAYTVNDAEADASAVVADRTLVANAVNVLPTPSGAAVTYQLPSSAAVGTWIKLINNSGIGTTVISASEASEGFIGTTDNTLSLSDTTANFELIKVSSTAADAWAIMAT